MIKSKPILENSENSTNDRNWNFDFWLFVSWENLVWSWQVKFQKCCKNDNFPIFFGWQLFWFWDTRYISTLFPLVRWYSGIETLEKKYFWSETVSQNQNIWPQKIGKLSFFNIFEIWTTNFKLKFLSSQMAKMQNFSVHQMQNFLNFSKMALLFF